MSDPTAFQPLSLDALFALEIAEPEWTVDGLLPEGSATLLSAREKAGKGLLTIDLCASVALGEPFLDRAVREGPAIYCAAEENVRDVRQRIATRLGGRRDAPFYVLPLDGSTDDRLKLDDVEAMQRLWGMVETIRPAVVVLDTLRELHDGKEDSSDEMGPLLRPVRQLAHHTNTAVVVNHHQNKGGGSRGSTAILASFDQGWWFGRDDADEADDVPPRGTLRVEGRAGPRRTLHVRLGEGLRWEPATPVIAIGEAGIRDRILGHLAAVNEGRTAHQIAAELRSALKTVQNELSRMRKESPCPVAYAGAGTKNDPRVYRSRSPAFWAQDHRSWHAEMVPSYEDPLGGADGGNHSGIDAGMGFDRSGTNRNHAGNHGTAEPDRQEEVF